MLASLAALGAVMGCTADKNRNPSSTPDAGAEHAGDGDDNGNGNGSGTTLPPSLEADASVPPAPKPTPAQWGPCDGTAPSIPGMSTLRRSAPPRIECATVAVPLDYRDPNGPTIDLALVRRPASAPSTRIGSLIVNPGGPGASGFQFVQRGALPGNLDERFDIVGFDPRGVGRSRGLACSRDPAVVEFRITDSDPDTPDEEVALDSVSQQVANACATEMDLLPRLHTDYVARDLDQIRQAVGDQKLSYLGFSYGTSIGLRYLELFPTNVRAMVLDGVVDPELDLEQLLTGQAEAIEKTLDATFARCGANPACPAKDPEALYERVADQLEAAPIPAGATTIGPADLSLAAIAATYDRSLEELLLGGLTRAAVGDGQAIRTLASTYTSSGEFGAYLAVVCTDLPHPTGAEDYRAMAARLKARAPRVGAAVANELRPCAYWSAAVAGAPHAVQAREAPPVLVVANRDDAATPHAWAERVVERLGNGSELLTFESDGHTAFRRSACVRSAVEAYLVGLKLPSPGTRCLG